MSERDTRPILEDVDDELVAGASAPPPTYSEVNEQQSSTPKQVSPLDQNELPPPYTPNAATLHINCKVCQAPIPLEGRQHLHVIKCGLCNEATPIKNAPPGKKYVRCPCNCLLICRVEAVRIACPRQNCRRMITLQTPVTLTTTSVTSAAGGTIRANCGHCGEVFVFLRMNMKHKLAICPHCNRRSCVGKGYIKRKALIFGLVGLFFLVAGIVTTAISLALSGGIGVYVIWIGAYVVGALNLLRAAIFCCVKVSTPIEP